MPFSRRKKFHRDFLYCQLLASACPLRNHVTLLFPISPKARTEMGVGTQPALLIHHYC